MHPTYFSKISLSEYLQEVGVVLLSPVCGGSRARNMWGRWKIVGMCQEEERVSGTRVIALLACMRVMRWWLLGCLAGDGRDWECDCDFRSCLE
jgi:hypothetical protein